MANLLLLADSNFTNNIKDYSGPMLQHLQVKSCQTRKAIMSEVGLAEEGIVVIASLDMMAANIARSTAANPYRAVEVYLNHFYHKLIDKLDESDGRLAFGVVAPLYWSSHANEVKRALRHSYECMKNLPVEKIFFSDPAFGINAGADGVHLTRRSANKYIELIHNLFLKIADDAHLGPVSIQGPSAHNATEAGSSHEADNSEVDNMDEDPEAVISLTPPLVAFEAIERQVSAMSASIVRSLSPNPRASGQTRTQNRLVELAQPDFSVPPPSARTTLTQPDPNWADQDNFDLRSSVQRIERKIGVIQSKAFYDNLMMALLKESQDTEANKAMLHKVTISGIALPNMSRMLDHERNNLMRSKVSIIAECIKEPGQTFEVKFA